MTCGPETVSIPPGEQIRFTGLSGTMAALTTKTAEVVVYGIWSDIDENWLTLPSGELFHTVFPSVAQAQLHSVTVYYPDVQAKLQFYVRELPPLETNDTQANLD